MATGGDIEESATLLRGDAGFGFASQRRGVRPLRACGLAVLCLTGGWVAGRWWQTWTTALAERAVWLQHDVYPPWPGCDARPRAPASVGRPRQHQKALATADEERQQLERAGILGGYARGVEPEEGRFAPLSRVARSPPRERDAHSEAWLSAATAASAKLAGLDATSRAPAILGERLPP